MTGIRSESIASPMLERELLCCAIEPTELALPRWAAVLETTPLESFDDRARRLLPAVWKNLRQGQSGFAQDEALRAVYQTTCEHNRRLRQACIDVVRLFQSRQVPVLIFKGVLLSQGVHGDLGVRPAHDFDLLVPFDQADTASEVLADDGWVKEARSIVVAERLENAVEFYRDGLKLDLHWALLREARQDWADEPLWRESQPFDVGGLSVLGLCPTHQLFHLLAVANREPHHLCRYLYDLHVSLKSFGESLDFRQVESMLRERHLLHRLESLPLEEMGWGYLRPSRSASLLDRIWSTVTRQRHDRTGEWLFALFPLFDYVIHFRHGEPPGWRFFPYLGRRLEMAGPADALQRMVRKLFRLIGPRNAGFAG